MNPNKISEAQAFSSGADLWVIKNDFNLKWWNDIDFRSGFLLSRCLFHNKIPIPSQITQLIAETELPLFQLLPLSQCLVVGSSAHFLNKWIDLFPHAKVLRYEDAGHYVLEDIGEPLCQEIFDFLKRQ